jgi:hypothetical protein
MLRKKFLFLPCVFLSFGSFAKPAGKLFNIAWRNLLKKKFRAAAWEPLTKSAQVYDYWRFWRTWGQFILVLYVFVFGWGLNEIGTLAVIAYSNLA